MAITTRKDPAAAGTDVRRFLVGALIIVAFFTSYSYAVAKNGISDEAAYDPYGSTVGGAGAGAAGSCCGGSPAPAPDPTGVPAGGGGCCGGSGEPIEGETVVDGTVQRITVDASNGYDPNIIYATAGIPIEITFGQGVGCFAEVYFPDFNIFEDLTAGAKTITLPPLDAGTYSWSCGMQMVFGTIVVE